MNRLHTFFALLAFLLCSTLHAQEQPTQWTLRSCIQYALEQNISIRQSRNTLDQNSVNTSSAKAALFPSLSFSTSQSYANQPYGGNGSTGSSYNDGSINSYNGSYRLSAQMTLYNGGKNVKNIRYSKLQEDVSRQEIAQQENQVELSITQAYMQILYAAEAIGINQATLRTDSAQLQRAREQLKAGMLTKTDVAQLESQLSTDQYQLVQALNQLATYKLQLKQLLELEGEAEMNVAFPGIADEQILSPLPSKADVYATALQIMPEIKGSELSLEAARLNEKIAKSGYMPTLSLQANTGTGHNSTNPNQFGQQLKTGWNNNLGLSLSLPIFDNRSNKSAVEKAKLQTLSTRLNGLEEQKTLYKSIESSWQDAYASQNEFLAASEKEKYANASFDLVSQQFSAGLKNTVELLTEKNNLLSAQQQKLQAKYMALLNMKILGFYQGQELDI